MGRRDVIWMSILAVAEASNLVALWSDFGPVDICFRPVASPVPARTAYSQGICFRSAVRRRARHAKNEVSQLSQS